MRRTAMPWKREGPERAKPWPLWQVEGPLEQGQPVTVKRKMQVKSACFHKEETFHQV